MTDPNPETTAAIERIDREIAATEQHQELLAGNALCMTCGQPGLHTHP